ncbi:hypothetical protein IPJ63_03895 [Candidatus Nomurabacteria bacterium]|nr:MAG: hypothetical protein IPJ63_03895 [Candidatus Nomurabacteria bacterium]
MNIIIKILSIIGALTFIVAGVTGAMQPFGDLFTNSIWLRAFEVLLGAVLLYNVWKLK